MITGIVAALPEEVSTLTKQKITSGSIAFLTENILLAQSGAGPANAQKAVRLLVEKGAKRIISWGCAAALDPSLNAGDLILPDILITEDLRQLFIRSGWHKQAVTLLGSEFQIHQGKLAESSYIISSGREKKTVMNKTNAIALDMESIAIAKAAKLFNLPCLVIRSIADTAAMDLPKAVSYAMNDEGNVELKKMSYYLITHPSQLPALIRLAVHFHAATRQLKLVAGKLDQLARYQPTTHNHTIVQHA